jgi:hypothetical protein
MIKFISFFITIILFDSSEFESELATGIVSRIKIVFEILILGIGSRPIYDRIIYFCGISLPLFICADPDSDIHRIWLRTIESRTSDKSQGFSIKYKSLKEFSSLHPLNYLENKIYLFFVCREKITHIMILVCLAKFLGKLSNINSSIQ